jgi:putative peptidoglycan lipid II flippase
MSTGQDSNRDAQERAQNVAAQGGIVSSMTMLSRILGLVRDMVLSFFFGASNVADAFFVAFRIPNFFRRLFAEGAFNQAFVPVLAEFRGGDRAELKHFIARMAGNLSVVLLPVVLIGMVCAPALVMVFAPGFWQDDARYELTRDMVRITFPYLGFISLTAFAGAVLNSHHRYAIPAFTPVLLNLSLISAVLFAADLFATPVLALAWGVLLAGLLQLAFQLPALQRLGLIVRPRVDFKHQGVRQVGRLLGPALFAASVHQINSLIDTMLASTLVVGSISWLYYSDRLFELPIGVVAVALGTVLLPNLSRLDASGARRQFSDTLDWGMRVGVLLGIPAAAALYGLAVPLIATIFLRGEMTPFDTVMAALSLQAFAIGLPALIWVKVLAPGYFARQDTATPFRFASISVVTNVTLNLALFSWWGHVGLAFATSVAGWVNALLLLRGLLRDGRYQPGRGLFLACVRASVSSAVMLALVFMLVPDAGQWLEADEFTRLQWLALAVAGGALVYVLGLLILGERLRYVMHRA